MPYNPGVSYQGAGMLAQGVSQGANRMADFAMKMIDDGKKADSLRKMIATYNPELGKASKSMNLSELEGFVGGMAMKRQEEAAKLQGEKARAEIAASNAQTTLATDQNARQAAQLRDVGGWAQSFARGPVERAVPGVVPGGNWAGRMAAGQVSPVPEVPGYADAVAALGSNPRAAMSPQIMGTVESLAREAGKDGGWNLKPGQVSDYGEYAGYPTTKGSMMVVPKKKGDAASYTPEFKDVPDMPGVKLYKDSDGSWKPIKMAGQEDNMPAQVMGTLTSLQSRLGGTMADLANPKLSNKERQVLEQDRARLESQIDQIQKGWRANRGAVAAGGGSSGGAADYIWKDGKLVKSGK